MDTVTTSGRLVVGELQKDPAAANRITARSDSGDIRVTFG
jgi:hypothetical protein